MKVSSYLAATALSGALLLPSLSLAQTAPANAPPVPTSTTTTNALPEGQARASQQSPDSPVSPEAVNADGSSVGSSGGDVVVTGSLIRRQNVDTFIPTLTTDRQYLDERNLTNVADAVNALPGVRGSVTPNGAQGSFGQGVNFINIGGLGSNRTLTLINGRRSVSSNPNTLFNQGSAGLQVDVNSIQSILVDRADLANIVGATLYGSDAIAGTVNYILRDRYKGITTTALTGITDQGDAFRYNLAILAGHDFLDGKLNITAAYTRDVQNGALYADRDFLRAGLSTVTNPTTAQAAALGRPAGTTPQNDGRINPNFGYNDSATDGNPGSILVRDRVLYQLTTGGTLLNGCRTATATCTAANVVSAANYNYMFDPSGNLVPQVRGINFAAPYASGGDGYRLFPYSQLTSQVQRHTGNLFVHYDAADALKFFFEGTYFASHGDQLVTQPTYNASLFGGLSGALTFSVNNPFLSQQAKQQLTSLGIQTFQLNRASDDLADTSGGTDTSLFRLVLGARGDFNVGDRKFYYEAYGNYGRTLLIDRSQDLNVQHFINAVNVTTNAAGQIVCNPTPAFNAAPGGIAPVADAGCVPLNLFGNGQPSAAARAYIIQNTRTRSVLKQKDFNARVGGSPFSLFGNDYAFAAGFEHREEDGSFTPDAFEQAGGGRSVAITPISGSYTVNEEYGEINLPVVQPSNHVPFINRLEFDASARNVDNSINGHFVAWSAGGLFSPFRDFSFRGNYTRSFRNPAITELFLPRVSSFVTVPDLCAPGNIGAGAAPAIRTANCQAFLAKYPNATPLDAASATVPGVNGGNLGLKNEVSYSYSLGGIFQPHWIPRLSITIDYVNIKIRNPIASLTVAQIASACFDNPNFNAADPANGNAFCSQIRRYAVGQGGVAANGGDRGGQVIVDPQNPGVSSGYVNGNRIDYSSIQAAVDYAIPFQLGDTAARFETGNTFFFLINRLNDNTGVAPLATDGTFSTGTNDPKFQFQSNNRLLFPGFGGISASVNFFGKTSAVRTALSTDLREINGLNSYATVDASVFFDVGKKYRLTLSVTNIGDRKYQDYYGYALPASYSNGNGDILGRRYAVSVRTQF